MTNQAPQAEFVPEKDEFIMSDKHFAAIAEIAQSRFGLSLQQSKKALVRSRLVRRLRAIGAADFDSYLGILAKETKADGEITHLLSALTTNVTHFFRERHHFDLLRQTALPPLISRARAGGRVRLWSAGCSSGEEPYSLAMTLLDSCPDLAKLNIKILATDVDPVIMGQARLGTYTADKIDPKDAPMIERYFDRTDAGLVAGAALRRLISFGQINLVANWPVKGPFDVIFCRNVAIYFEKATQETLWQRFCDVLAPGGYLIIGHSERVSGPALGSLRSVGITAYQKTMDGVSVPRADQNAPNGDNA